MSAPSIASARFYAILDTGYVAPARWSEVCRALLLGGSDLVQLRAKRESPAKRRQLLDEILPLFVPGVVVAQPPPLIVNDDLALALAYPGVGLHVGQDDLPVREARARLGPDRLLGLSTHAIDQAAAAENLPAGVIDYFAVGPVFATATKPDYTPVGLQLVRDVAATRPQKPWFTIGGINRRTVGQVVAAGSRRIVVVSDVLTATDPAGAIRELTAALPPA